jgi:sec-independent protein translocase protein TatC
VKNLTDNVKKKVPKKTSPELKSSVKSVIKNDSRKKAVKKAINTNKMNTAEKKSAVKINKNKLKSANNAPIRKPDRKINKLPAKIEEDIIDPSALARGDDPMTIVEHLTELRSRLMLIVVSFFVLFCVAFYFSDFLVHMINKPFMKTGFQLNIFTLTGGFMVKMKVSAAISILILVPLIIFHIWRFISPAIEKPERFFSRITITTAVLLFYAGVGFVFFVLPLTIEVLLSFIDKSMLSTIGADDYLHFIFFMSFIMGFLCELPIAILIMTKMGIITPHFLISKRKYALVIIWITAAIVTPGPDLLSQSLVGIPLMFLYEVSIVISKIVLKRKKRRELKLRNN